MGGITDQVSHFAPEAVDKVASTVSQAGKKSEQLKNTRQQLMGTCRIYISDNPFMSLGIAAVVGFLLSGTWMELVFAAVLMLVQYGVDANSAILFAIAFNFMIALTLWGAIYSKSRYSATKQ